MINYPLRMLGNVGYSFSVFHVSYQENVTPETIISPGLVSALMHVTQVEGLVLVSYVL